MTYLVAVLTLCLTSFHGNAATSPSGPVGGSVGGSVNSKVVNQLHSSEVSADDPEAASGMTAKQAVAGQKFMVVAANPYASEAGFRILKQGGSAIDAAIAVQAVLTLVEPQSSGIGGGSFILHWDAKAKQLISYDGRETAPEKATPALFMLNDKQPMRWLDAVVGGKSVGVPGTLKALALAHSEQGKLPWAVLFDYAIELADQGFAVSPRLVAQLVSQRNPGLLRLKTSADYFYPNGQVLHVGQTKTNKPLAAIFKQIAKQGVDAFYRGDNAKAIVAAVQNNGIQAGLLSLSDLANYQAKKREALCDQYHQYRICSMGPPSSGGFTVLQTLALLADKNLAQYQPNQTAALHLFTQASRLAFADRNHYIGDTDFVDVPLQQLLAPGYVKQRAKLINLKQDMGQAQPGSVANYAQLADDDAIELPSTSHLSIVDSQGNGVSMTTSIEFMFGSGIMVNGYLLNNQLTDFSFTPQVNGKWVANRIEPLKRPRSSMSPVMVFDEKGQLKILLGSPGGSRIINYVSQTLIAVLDWGLDIQQAINLPKISNLNGKTALEQDTDIAGARPALEQLKHNVVVGQLNSGLHGIMISEKGLLGGADPRREGVVLGL